MALVAEIVGPAGAGKSTVAEVLGRGGAGAAARLGVWRLPAGLLLSSAFLSLPQLVGMLRGRGRPGFQELALVVRINALGRLVGREAARRQRFVLLDEGTVFALAKLYAFGRAEGRLRGLVRRWAGMLDAVVWLDAPDEVLARRIRGRAKPHRMKARTDEEISAFLARYRESYERVVKELSAGGRVRVIRLSTGEGETPERVAERVLAGIEGGNRTRG
ncbi:MAG TPA: AAA family ATPase [Pyrinomonadaceae bacterium]|nr:AAA family ATPase [Pyrinomonadaceae bacterium]